MNATTLEAANTTATSPSPSKKRSLSNASTTLSKRTKKNKSTVDKDGTQEITKEEMITDLITSSSSSEDGVSGENAIPTKNKLVWDSKW